MPVIAVSSKKGGSGKTTVTINIADALHAAGERVLVLDADPQRTAMNWPLHADDVSLTPAVLSVDATLAAPTRVPALKAAFDWILIDCPPRHGDTITAAFSVADLILVPVRPSLMDLEALGATIEEIQAAQRRRPVQALAVINQRSPKSKTADETPALIIQAGLAVASTQMGLRVDYLDAYAQGLGVCRSAPKSKAAAEIKALLAEVRALLAPPPPTLPAKRRK